MTGPAPAAAAPYSVELGDAELEHGRELLVQLLAADRDLGAAERQAIRLALLRMSVAELRTVLRADGDPPAASTTPAPLADGSAVDHPHQAAADDIAAGLAQLGWVLRQHPWLAPELRWELSGLAPRMLVSPAAMHEVHATAAAVGARSGLARHASAAVRSVVLEFGQHGSVRLLLTTPAVEPAPLFMSADDRPTTGAALHE